MSRQGNCYDNATMESFWSTLKLEIIYRRRFTSRRQAQSDIFDYIESFYNRQRRHTSLGGLSPADFEAKILLTITLFLCPFFRSRPISKREGDIETIIAYYQRSKNSWG